ncbi:MAG: hypothetical protein Q8Q07_06610 [Dehalococcoidales bacterium]|nr:hypothetical protein [Dehalococcoidales bacterium]
MEINLKETAFQRAKKDTIEAQKTAKFMWGGEGVLAVAGGAWFQSLAPAGAFAWEVVWRSVIGGLIGLSVAILFIYGWNLFRAPYWQRNEARALLLARPQSVPLRNRKDLFAAIHHLDGAARDMVTAHRAYKVHKQPTIFESAVVELQSIEQKKSAYNEAVEK